MSGDLVRHSSLSKATSRSSFQARKARQRASEGGATPVGAGLGDELSMASSADTAQGRILTALFGTTVLPAPDVWPSSPHEKAKIFNQTTFGDFRLKRRLYAGEGENLMGDPDIITDAIKGAMNSYRQSTQNTVSALRRFFRAIRIINKYARLRRDKKGVLIDDFVAMWEGKEEELREEYQQHMKESNYRIHHTLQDSREEFAKTCTPTSVKREVVSRIHFRYRLQSARRHKVWLLKYVVVLQKLNEIKNDYAGEAQQLMTMALRDKLRDLRRQATETLLMKPVEDFGVHSVSIKQLLAVAEEIHAADKEARGQEFLTEFEAQREKEQNERRKEFEKIALRRETEYRAKKREELRDEKNLKAQEKDRVSKILDRRFRASKIGASGISLDVQSSNSPGDRGEDEDSLSTSMSSDADSRRRRRQSSSQMSSGQVSQVSASVFLEASQRRQSKAIAPPSASVIAGTGYRRSEMMSAKDGSGELFKKTANAIAASKSARNSAIEAGGSFSSTLRRGTTTLTAGDMSFNAMSFNAMSMNATTFSDFNTMTLNGESIRSSNSRSPSIRAGSEGGRRSLLGSPPREGQEHLLVGPQEPDNTAAMEEWQQYYVELDEFNLQKKSLEEERALIKRRAKELASGPIPELKPFHALRSNTNTVHQPGKAFIRIISTDQEEREKYLHEMEKARIDNPAHAHFKQRVVATPSLVPRVVSQGFKRATSALALSRAAGPELTLEQTQINTFTESSALTAKEVNAIRKRPSSAELIPPYKEVPRPDDLTLLVKVEKAEVGHVSKRAERLYSERRAAAALRAEEHAENMYIVNRCGEDFSSESHLVGGAPPNFSTIRPSSRSSTPQHGSRDPDYSGLNRSGGKSSAKTISVSSNQRGGSGSQSRIRVLGTAGLARNGNGDVVDEAALPAHHSSVHPSFLSHNMKLKAHKAFTAMIQQGSDGYHNRI